MKQAKSPANPVAVGRFAPSTTGPAHPGTLLAALLCWLDARAVGGRVWLRLEDLDPERSRPAWVDGLQRDLEWLGLDWDGVVRQHARRDDHDAALDRLADAGRLYPCRCTRATLRASGVRTPDGGFRYPGTCRGEALPRGGWRVSDAPIRARLEPGVRRIEDGSGAALDQDPVESFGDPIVRRRDGAAAYHLASVVDDAALGVTRVVRGRDLATSTATQVALAELLGLPRPAYRHHLLLLEERGEKLAKLHGSVSLAELRPTMDAPAIVGWLAHASGLQREATPTRPAELVAAFDWSRVAREDRVVRFGGGRLELIGEPR